MKKQVLFKTITTIIAVIIIIGSLYFAHSFAKYKGRTPDYKIQVMLNIEPIDFVMFSFSGTEESLYIPVGGYYYISAWGGNGGLGGRGEQTTLTQSLGGESQEISGVYYLNEGDTVYLYVGSAGESAPEGNGAGTGFLGGTNGLNIGNNSGTGGMGGAGAEHPNQGNSSGAGGGGGAASFVLSASQDISSIILASAGGGGGGRWWWSCWWKY